MGVIFRNGVQYGGGRAADSYTKAEVDQKLESLKNTILSATVEGNKLIIKTSEEETEDDG